LSEPALFVGREPPFDRVRGPIHARTRFTRRLGIAERQDGLPAHWSDPVRR
jgi:hypothetical protein